MSKTITISARRFKAYERAETLAREVRRQLAETGKCANAKRLYGLVAAWMQLAGQRGYLSPVESRLLRRVKRKNKV